MTTGDNGAHERLSCATDGVHNDIGRRVIQEVPILTPISHASSVTILATHVPASPWLEIMYICT